MDINVRGVNFFYRAVLPTMMDNDYGKIVNVTSVMSVVAAQGQSIYNTGQGAAKMMTQGIAVDVSGYNINVNAVGPGMVLTGQTQNMLGDPEQAEYFLERIPMRTSGSRRISLRPCSFCTATRRRTSMARRSLWMVGCSARRDRRRQPHRRGPAERLRGDPHCRASNTVQPLDQRSVSRGGMVRSDRI
jgi:NAD(P)-dependent dehydrogenase (short-subunit alcohol dehydrogenase family)